MRSDPMRSTSLDLTAPDVVADPYPHFAAERELARGRLARAVRDVPDLHARDGRRGAARPPARAALARPGAAGLPRAVQPAAPQPDDGERAAGAHPAAPARSPGRSPAGTSSGSGRGCASSRRPLLADIDPDGFDVIADYAEPLPVLVIAELLGVPRSHAHDLRDWSQAIVRMYEVAPAQQTVDDAVRAADGLRRPGPRARRRAPRDARRTT